LGGIERVTEFQDWRRHHREVPERAVGRESSVVDPLTRCSAFWSIDCRRVATSGEVGQPEFPPRGDDFAFQFLEVPINAL